MSSNKRLEPVYVRVPSDKQWVRRISDVKVNARSSYDYVSQNGDSDKFLQPGARLHMEPGTVLLVCRRNRKEVSLTILLPDGTWYAPDKFCAGNDWAILLRGYARSWTTLSRSGRVVRALREILDGLHTAAAAGELPLDAQYLETISEIQQMIAEILGVYSGTTSTDVLKSFQAWADETAERNKTTVEDVLAVINNGAAIDDAHTREELANVSPTIVRGLDSTTRHKRAIELEED